MSETIVKTIVLYAALVVFPAPLLSAQVSTQEWRPNIGEDNKAATFEDTIGFISNSLSVYSNGTTVSVPGSCRLNVESHGVATIGFTVKTSDEHSLEIVSVQPGSAAEAAGLAPGLKLLGVSVNGEPRVDSHDGKRLRTPQDFAAMETTLHAGDKLRVAVYSEHLPSTRVKPYRKNGLIGDVEFILPTNELGQREIDLRKVDPLSITVRSGNELVFSGFSNGPFATDLSAKPPTLIATPLKWAVAEPDIAKRLARALMHASLLCGGTKAVSPF